MTALIGLDAGAASTHVVTTGALVCVPDAEVGSLCSSRPPRTGSAIVAVLALPMTGVILTIGPATPPCTRPKVLT
jgi:hypothetical protein